MVQRKVPSKLGIQADLVNSYKLLGNLKKQASCLLQDGKSRGPEMKKKMKRSRSIKLSDFESLKSTPLGKPVSQSEPGKSSPLSSTPASVLQRPSMVRITDGSPHYMKGTTCSEARKERSPVSSSASHGSSDSKNPRRRTCSSSKIESCSGNKSMKSLNKSSSLKFVRTLTQSPSFKLARASAKKCSRVAFCAADVDVQRATCSSTLKDSKFPDYLMLNPGGTDAEGTSVVEVCPYTYCSLNGHHHTPLPPLKCFLKAKRRSLKAQKSVKLQALSPRKSKLFDEEIDHEFPVYSVDKKPLTEMESAGLMNIPLIHEVGTDFFVEIYAKGAENKEKTEEITLDVDNDKQEEDEECSTNLCDKSLPSDVDSKENFEQSSNDMDEIGEFPMVHQEEDSDAEQPDQEDTIGSSGSGSDIGGECLRDYDSFSEVSDMEWDEDRFSVSKEFLSDNNKLESLDTRDMDSSCTEEILVDEVLKELFGEETASFNTESCNSDLEIDGVTESLQILESTENYQHCSTEDLFNEEESGEKDQVAGTYLITVLDSAEEPIMESTVAGEDLDAENGLGETNTQLQDAENDCNTRMSTEDLIDKQEKRCLEDQISDSSPEKTVNESETNGNFDDNQKLDKSASELDDTDGGGHSLQNFAGKTETAEPHNDSLKEEHDEAKKVGSHASKQLEEQSNSMVHLHSSGGNCSAEIDNVEDEVFTESDPAETMHRTCNETEAAAKGACRYSRSKAKPEATETCNNRRWTIGCAKPIIKDLELQRKFNPKEPNFLPLIPDPDAEKVDLKHQEIDDRKNAEEWMLDHALQQAVSKLAPARKRKVALLVEAFETVLPTPEWETQMRRASSTFSHTRPIQACS